MKARVKPIMKEPYMPKVREVDGTKHQMSREEYRQYVRANPQKRAEMLVHSGNVGKNVRSIMENFKAAMEEHKEIARKNGKPILSGVPMEEEIDEPTIYKKQKLDRDDIVVTETLGTSSDATYTDEFKEDSNDN